MGRPRLGNEFSSSMQSARGFSSGSDLPPHQEIGMPSLSPTMTEGNISRWLKKEGDKVSPREVLCEVETDKATVEMECMEEGFLAKIIKAEGSKEIQVGEVIAITVEDEEDIGKFKITPHHLLLMPMLLLKQSQLVPHQRKRRSNNHHRLLNPRLPSLAHILQEIVFLLVLLLES